MATKVRDLRAWLNGLDGDASVGIDDGGLALQVLGDEENYYEVGGIPLPAPDDEESTND